jgi:hypothetical protein
MEVSAGVATVTAFCPMTDPKLAVIVAAPAASACTRPLELTCADAGADDDQFTKLLMLMLGYFGKVPAAMSVC